MVHEMSKTVEILNLHSKNEATADFCEKNSPQFIDDECARINFYSSRWAAVMRPTSEVKNVIDFDQSATARMVYNLKKIGVIFQNEKPFYQKVGHGHISLRIDGIISKGFPDFPNESGLLFVRRVTKMVFNNLSLSSTDYVSKNANLLMAIGGFKKSAILYICDQTGQIAAQVVELDLRAAHKIYETVNLGVESPSIPPRVNNEEKCNSCPFNGYCVLPDSPSPTCRNCINFVIGKDGYAACYVKDNQRLSIDEQMNLHKCNMHLYSPDFLSSWAKHIDGVSTEEIGQSDIVTVHHSNEYVNILTGEIFVNVIDSSSGGYTSYEIYGSKGKELIGNGKIDKIKKMFNATIQDD